MDTSPHSITTLLTPLNSKMLDSGLMASAAECIGEVDELLRGLLVNSSTTDVNSRQSTMHKIPTPTTPPSLTSSGSYHLNHRQKSSSSASSAEPQHFSNGSSVKKEVDHEEEGGEDVSEVNRTLFWEDENTAIYAATIDTTDLNWNKTTPPPPPPLPSIHDNMYSVEEDDDPVFVYSGAIGRVSNIVYSSHNARQFPPVPPPPSSSSRPTTSQTIPQHCSDETREKFMHFLSQRHHKSNKKINSNLGHVNSKNENVVGTEIASKNIVAKMKFLEEKVKRLENELSELRTSPNNTLAISTPQQTSSVAKTMQNRTLLQKTTQIRDDFDERELHRGNHNSNDRDDGMMTSPTFVSHFSSLSCPQLEQFDNNYNHVFINPAISPRSMRKLTLKHRYNKLIQEQQAEIRAYHQSSEMMMMTTTTAMNQRRIQSPGKRVAELYNHHHHNMGHGDDSSNHSRRSVFLYEDTNELVKPNRKRRSDSSLSPTYLQMKTYTTPTNNASYSQFALDRLRRRKEGRGEKFHGIPWRP
jgi:hypothetical protein